MSRALVLYHGDCADGFCAAWCAYRKLGDRADYLPVFHGQDPPNVEGRDVYLLDFSYKSHVLAEMARIAKSLVILDHHKTAMFELTRMPGPNTKVVFDLNKSGGRLAWEYFRPGFKVPWLVEYTEDRDLWRWKLPQSREINAAMASYPRTFEQWDAFYFKIQDDSLTLKSLADQGAAILRYQNQVVESQSRHAREIEMDGHKVLSVNATTLISEIGHKLAEGRPFSATWFQRSDGKKIWSLRSREDGLDVSEIARRHGGGGHRNAAGFEE